MLALIGSTESAIIADENLPSLETIEQEILEHRHQLHTGHFKVRITGENVLRGNKAAELLVDTIIDGSRIREELVGKDGSIIAALDDTFYYWYSTKPPQTGHPVALQVQELRSADPRELPRFYQPFMLMLHPLDYYNGKRFHEKSFVAAEARSNIKLESTVWEEQPAYRVSFSLTFSRSSDVFYIVVPSLGFSIVRMEQTAKLGASRLTEVVQSSVAEIGPGVWFPRKVRYEHLISNKVASVQELDIEVTDVNKRFDATVFGPKYMKVPANTGVYRKPGNDTGRATWDGDHIVIPDNPRLKAELAASSPQPHKGSRLLLLLSAVCAMLGILFVHKLLRNRSGNGKGSTRDSVTEEIRAKSSVSPGGVEQ